jgi:cytochrome c553
MMASDPLRLSIRLVVVAGAMTFSALAVLASGLTARAQTPPGATAPKPPAAATDKPLHGEELAGAVCTSCHGPTGNSPDPQYPKIAGQKSYYLRTQLHDFKRGVRKSEVMAPLAAALSDTQIRELARFYSQQKVKPDAIKDRRLADLGSRIFHYPGRGVPACAACHSPGGYGPGMMGGRGMMGRGMMGGGMMHGGMMWNAAATPNLFGQHTGYITQQLNAFASGKRRATVMGPIAARLSPHERRAVAEYLSGRQ